MVLHYNRLKSAEYGRYARDTQGQKSNPPRVPGTHNRINRDNAIRHAAAIPAVYLLLCIYNIFLCNILYIRFRLFIAFAHFMRAFAFAYATLLHIFVFYALCMNNLSLLLVFMRFLCKWHATE